MFTLMCFLVHRLCWISCILIRKYSGVSVRFWSVLTGICHEASRRFHVLAGIYIHHKFPGLLAEPHDFFTQIFWNGAFWLNQILVPINNIQSLLQYLHLSLLFRIILWIQSCSLKWLSYRRNILWFANLICQFHLAQSFPLQSLLPEWTFKLIILMFGFKMVQPFL